jgi:hypothetical protein
VLRLRVLPRDNTVVAPRRLRLNSRPFTLLRTLLHYAKSQTLCNHANPNSLRKMPGVWHRGRLCGTPGVGYAPPTTLHDTLPLLSTLSESKLSRSFSVACGLLPLSLPSFSRTHPLFSKVCSLFFKNTRGMGTPSDSARRHPAWRRTIRLLSFSDPSPA